MKTREVKNPNYPNYEWQTVLMTISRAEIVMGYAFLIWIINCEWIHLHRSKGCLTDSRRVQRANDWRRVVGYHHARHGKKEGALKYLPGIRTNAERTNFCQIPADLFAIPITCLFALPTVRAIMPGSPEFGMSHGTVPISMLCSPKLFLTSAGCVLGWFRSLAFFN